MIKFNPNGRREAWHTVKIVDDGKEADLRVKYALLTDDEASGLLDETLAKIQPTADGTVTQIDALREQLRPGTREEMRSILRDRIIEWDLADQNGQLLPMTADNVNAVLNYTGFLKPLHDGLIAASTGATVKN